MVDEVAPVRAYHGEPAAGTPIAVLRDAVYPVVVVGVAVTGGDVPHPARPGQGLGQFLGVSGFSGACTAEHECSRRLVRTARAVRGIGGGHGGKRYQPTGVAVF